MEDCGNKWIGDWLGQKGEGNISFQGNGLKDNRLDEGGGKAKKKGTIRSGAGNRVGGLLLVTAPIAAGLLRLGAGRRDGGNGRGREERQ